ncbi:hypothetical protein EXN66_Car016602 [Channa argus]|uniref:Uncharacterized protein n=1 Tax=Channa argus TaxID=215402 RepID=A0A6G1QEQ9_CHAAH|nr:hypothetical protein EXN66_Car016602 [Channa argus]
MSGSTMPCVDWRNRHCVKWDYIITFLHQQPDLNCELTLPEAFGLRKSERGSGYRGKPCSEELLL